MRTIACLLFLLPQAGELNEQLFDAARKGDAAAVQALLAKGADVNAKGRYDVTALHLAADKGHLAVVEALIRHKANLNARDTFYNSTPLSWAVQKGHADVAKALMKSGATGADTTLATAAAMGNLDLVWFILDHAKVSRPALNRARPRPRGPPWRCATCSTTRAPIPRLARRSTYPRRCCTATSAPTAAKSRNCVSHSTRAGWSSSPVRSPCTAWIRSTRNCFNPIAVAPPGSPSAPRRAT